MALRSERHIGHSIGLEEAIKDVKDLLEQDQNWQASEGVEKQRDTSEFRNNILLKLDSNDFNFLSELLDEESGNAPDGEWDIDYAGELLHRLRQAEAVSSAIDEGVSSRD